MESVDLRPGVLVENPHKPEWGPGKIAHIRGEMLYVFFRDVPDDVAKKFRRDGLQVAAVQSDPILDNLPPFTEQGGELFLPNERLTVESARNRFLRHYSRGFADPKYIGSSTEGERTYKVQAHERIHQFYQQETGGQGISSGRVSELVKELFRALGTARNLLAKTEFIAFGEGLEEANAAEAYFTTLFALIESGPVESTFMAHAEAVASLPARGGTHTDKWTIATICPFLARPDVFMFVKPEITKAAASALAFDIHYDPRPNWRTYDAVLRMSRLYTDKLADLDPSDFIDIHSFFWITGGKFEETLAAQQKKRSRGLKK